MTKRESGWYRVKFSPLSEWELAEYSRNDRLWALTESTDNFRDGEIHTIDPKMVMTPAGEIVYHNAEHNPVYNTKQEG